jgi:hypothetical protein
MKQIDQFGEVLFAVLSHQYKSVNYHRRDDINTEILIDLLAFGMITQIKSRL